MIGRDPLRWYTRNAWYVAGFSKDLPVGKAMGLTILGQPLAIWRGADGMVRAFDDRCAHRLAPLSKGRCEGNRLRCMYHGLLYEDDGRVSAVPGQTGIPPQARVRAYPACEHLDWIWVWMGEAADADHDLLPVPNGYNPKEFVFGYGQIDYAAEARLICDNLLDLSHVAFLHSASFQSEPEFADRLPLVSAVDRGVRVRRWIENTHGSSTRRSTAPVDAYQTYDFLVPGILLMWSANFRTGTAAKDSKEILPLDSIDGLSLTLQAVTPMTDQAARYFFNSGPHRRDGDEAKRDAMMEMAAQAFSEDREMIEAQQVLINIDPARRIVPSAHDRATTIYSGIVRKLNATRFAAAPCGSKEQNDVDDSP